MILRLEDGSPIRGDLILRAVLRNDCTPMPVTLEAEIRTDAGLAAQLAEGKRLTTGTGATLKVIKQQRVTGRNAQGQHALEALKIIAILDEIHTLTFTQPRGIFLEQTSLAEIFTACGATHKGVQNDVAISRFYLFAGEVPTFAIAQILQESGGVMSWKMGALKFQRIADIFAQNPVIQLPKSATKTIESEHLERHSIPAFFSLNEHGELLRHAGTKARAVNFAPKKTDLELLNMSTCLVQKCEAKIPFSGQIHAGDCVGIVGEKKPLAVLTVAHVFESGSDAGGRQNAYSKLWLAEKNAP